MKQNKFGCSELNAADMKNLSCDCAPANYIDTVMQKIIQEINDQKDKLIKEFMLAKGIDPEDKDNIKLHCNRIIYEEEPYVEHYYFDFGKATEIRIISFILNHSLKVSDMEITEAFQYY